MAEIVLKNIDKSYDGNNKVVSDFNLEIHDKEFIVFVGPSGCGKTTTLRMIAGLEEITSGEIKIDEKIVNDVPPKNRDIAMVFQNYALYPHMSVYENMAFGLKLRKFEKSEIDERVNLAAGILGLTDLLDRKPKELSGGQKQRVAVGRAIVRKPKVFLFDEPLSNLDAKLRVQMRTEISKLHKELGATMIYVTHDQTEAMTMADRIVIMKDGIIQQIDTPMNLYNNPANKFVGGFIGSPAMNFIEAEVVSTKSVSVKDIPMELPDKFEKVLEERIGKKITIGVRPEDINPSDKGISVDIDLVEPLGNESLLYLSMNGFKLIARDTNGIDFSAIEKIFVEFDYEKIHLFDFETGSKL